MTPIRATQVQLIRHAMDPNIDYKKLSSIIKNDVVLTYRILRLVNSNYYGIQYEIQNVRQALAILGINNIRKYVTLLTLERLAGEKPEELMLMSLARGHFLEMLAPFVRMRKQREDLFLLGLFSLMDVLSDTPITEIIEKTKLSKSVADSLTNTDSKGAELLRIIKNYEQGNFDAVEEIAKKYNIPLSTVSRLYIESIDWATEILK
jgi:EAL and modified HD-GYP domain-containing signal transduction protein